MKTHHLWTLVVASAVAITLGNARGQTLPAVMPYAPVSGGVPPSVDACGACGGTGCGICGRPARSQDVRLISATQHLSAASCCSQGGCLGGAGCNIPQLGPGAAYGPTYLTASGAPTHHSAYGGYSTQHKGSNSGPFGGKGCCTPIWYDAHAEFLYLTRDRISDTVPFTSRNINGNIVLSTDDLSFDEASGFRATYAYLIGPSTNLELSYFGTHTWADEAFVTGNGDLYSVFSDFGTQPIGGFPQTDGADLHGIAYSSELHSSELNLRQRWVSANCLLHGSRLIGFRYFALDEDFNHFTRVAGGGSLDYFDTTQNDLYGLQLGTDLYVCISPRFKLGAEVEAGLYANRAAADTLAVTDTPSVLNEFESDTDVAFASEASVIGVFKVTPRFNIRGAYQVLYLDGVALAAENFNTESPFATRQSFIDNEGNVFYHGASLGFEWLW